MRKQNLLKLAFSFMALFLFVGAFAQTINHSDDVAYGTNYVEADTDITYQTVGLGFRLYVLPDPVYSPDYDGTGVAGTDLNDNSLWRWVSGADYDTGDEVKAATNENWVDINPTTPGTTIYWVLETFGPVSCQGSAQEHEVTITGAPNITAFEGVGTDWEVVTAGTAFRRCADGADIGDILNITIAEEYAPVAAQEYTYGISVLMEELDGNMALMDDDDVTATYGRAATMTSTGLNQTHTIPALPLVNNNPTRYTFTMTPNSLYSMISRTSDLRAGNATETAYPVSTIEVSYLLLPVPTTGPIFHIPNAF